LAVLS